MPIQEPFQLFFGFGIGQRAFWKKAAYLRIAVQGAQVFEITGSRRRSSRRSVSKISMGVPRFFLNSGFFALLQRR
jgi:hypothetical protein